MKRMPALTLLSACLLAAGCSISNADSAGTGIDPAVAKQAMDRWQIEELMWRYARALDTVDADGYAAVYTPDGSFSAGGGTSITGHDALHKYIADMKKSREERIAKGETVAGTLHMSANEYIEFTGPDSATVHAYWITMFPGVGTETPARMVAVGRSADQVVRVDGKWLIKVRDVAPQD